MKSLSLDHPAAIIMVGIPGSGKTQFAEKFSDTFRAPFLELDALVRQIGDAKIAAAVAKSQLEQLLRTKSSVVLELETYTRAQRSELLKILKRHSYQPIFVWVQTEKDIARGRIDSSRESTFERICQSFVGLTAIDKPVVISGRHTYATQARAVLKRLSEKRSDRTAGGSRTPARTTQRIAPKRNISIS